jgi:uncharacterized protein (DUF433 family)
MEGQSGSNGSPKAEIDFNSGNPKIKGTRTTVYFIYEFYKDGLNAEQIAAETSNLTVAQIQCAIDYIEARKEEISAQYEEIMEPIRRGNPPWIEALRVEGHRKALARLEELKAAHAAKSK